MRGLKKKGRRELLKTEEVRHRNYTDFRGRQDTVLTDQVANYIKARIELTALANGK